MTRRTTDSLLRGLSKFDARFQIVHNPSQLTDHPALRPRGEDFKELPVVPELVSCGCIEAFPNLLAVLLKVPQDHAGVVHLVCEGGESTCPTEWWNFNLGGNGRSCYLGSDTHDPEGSPKVA